MTANNNTPTELLGSKLYFQKPLKISDLSSLWKYVLWRIEDGRIVTGGVEGFGGIQSQEIIANNNRECQSFMNTGGQTPRSVIIEEHKHKIGGKQSESLMLGRKRLSRTHDSHMNFFGGELAGTSGKFGLDFIYLFAISAVAARYKSNTCCLVKSSTKSKKPA